MTAATAVPEELTGRFEERYGATPAGVWAAPGRVNLIGEHTDYNDGFVLPIALAERVYVAAAPRSDGRLRAASLQADTTVDVPIADLEPGTVDDWAAYVAGVAWALRRRDVPMAGADLLVDGRVPLGGGLSSSAAIECGVAVALAELARAPLESMELARVAQQAENLFVGAPTGLMDQVASMMCRPGHALLLDIEAMETRHVPFDPGAAGLRLLIMDTGVRHAHADGEYGDRRRACEEAARLLGVTSLRRLDDPEPPIDRLADPILRRRVRHVVSENARVLSAVAALEAGDWPHLGSLMSASHVSMRDDYEISSDELDVAVEAAMATGALGARMTGGGFGGSAIAIVPSERADDVTAAVADAYAARGWKPPTVSAAEPSGGAGRVQ